MEMRPRESLWSTDGVRAGMTRLAVLVAALALVPTASAGLAYSVEPGISSSQDCIPDVDVRIEAASSRSSEECDPTSGHVGSNEIACIYYDLEQEPLEMVQYSSDCPVRI